MFAGNHVSLLEYNNDLAQAMECKAHDQSDLEQLRAELDDRQIKFEAAEKRAADVVRQLAARTSELESAVAATKCTEGYLAEVSRLTQTLHMPPFYPSPESLLGWLSQQYAGLFVSGAMRKCERTSKTMNESEQMPICAEHA